MSAPTRRHVALVGLSHKSAPLEERERIAVDASSAADAAQSLLELEGVEESVVVSTCNRVEIYVAGEAADLARRVGEHLCARSDINARWLEQYTYARGDRDAIKHLFRVTSSLDSLVLGEPQIVGQVKQAYAAAQDAGATGQWLNRLFTHAFKTAKRVRTETGVAENAVSVSFAAVELAKKVFGRLAGKSVLVIGAGKMGGLAVKHLRQAGVDRVHIANRSIERAREMATQLGGTAHTLGELPDLLSRVDIVISSTGAQSFVVPFDMAKDALTRRKYRPLFLIDIAVPRDIDPRCDGLTNVYLFTVDDLEKVVQANRAAREQEAMRAETIVDEETEAMLQWAAQAEVVPTIVGLRQKLNAIRDSEVERMKRQHPELSPEALEAAERLARAITNKVLHEPTISLREASGSPVQSTLVAAVRSLFALHDEIDTQGRPKAPETT